MNISSNPGLSINKTACPVASENGTGAMPSLILWVILYDLSVQKRLFDFKRINSSNRSSLHCMDFELLISLFYLFFDPLHIH